MEVAVAVAALLHPLVLLLRQLSLLGRPVNNPQEVPARQLTLQPTPSNLVLPLNKAKAPGSSDKCSLQLRKHSSFSRPFFHFQVGYCPDILDHKSDIILVG